MRRRSSSRSGPWGCRWRWMISARGASPSVILKPLRWIILKIDGQFVRDLCDDPLDEAAVRCFSEVARIVGVKTVAEFVDRPEVLAKLRAMGVDYTEGFLLYTH